MLNVVFDQKMPIENRRQVFFIILGFNMEHEMVKSPKG